MGWLRFPDTARERLHRFGLNSAADVLALPGVIVGGHTSRHCLRVQLPDGSTAYLKKQHRVPWKERWASFWAGFGWVSSSTREAVLLCELQGTDHPGPEVLAWGEHSGQAFVLLAAVDGMEELRSRLDRADSEERRRLATALGSSLGKLHRAGYDHPDLSAKHVLVGESGGAYRFRLLDWQRGRRGLIPDRHRQVRPLAVLDATVADELADRRTRLVFLRAYLRAGGGLGPLGWWVDAIGRRRRHLEARPRLREQRRRSSDVGEEGMVWVDGEALCVAPDWPHERLRSILQNPDPPAQGSREAERVETVALPAPAGRRYLLTRRWFARRTWFLPWSRERFPAPEFAAGAALVRLRRIGLTTARMLALGRRDLTRRRRYSFLLVDLPAAAVPVRAWFCRLDARGRDRLFGRLVRMLRDIHEAGYRLRDADRFVSRDVLLLPEDGSLLVAGAAGLERTRKLPADLARQDVPALTAALPWSMAAVHACHLAGTPKLQEVPA